MPIAIAKLIGTSGAAKIAASPVSGVPPFSGVAYSGAIVSRGTLSIPLDADYIIDLSSFSTGKNVKSNLDHKEAQRVGHITQANNDGSRLTVDGLLSAATPYRDEVLESARNGFTWEVSIEAALPKPRLLRAGERDMINRRVVTGPLYVFSRGRLTGLAFVNNGADAGNAITIAASATTLRQLKEQSCR